MESRRRHGRPPVGADARALIRTMSEHNPLWEHHAFTVVAKLESTSVSNGRHYYGEATTSALADVAHVSD